MNRHQRRVLGLPNPFITPRKRIAHCHVEVRNVAREAAAAHYEELMSASNWSFSQWKLLHPTLVGEALQAAFMDEHWGKYIGFAKATMATLLTSPTVDQPTKDAIFEALSLDNTLQRGRANIGTSRVLNAAIGEALLKTK